MLNGTMNLVFKKKEEYKVQGETEEGIGEAKNGIRMEQHPTDYFYI